jgi:hypothetical protein
MENWTNINDIIAKYKTKYALEPKTEEKWREATTIYAGHFFIFQDAAKLGEGGGKWHLLHADKHANTTYVYGSYSKEKVEEVAAWLTETGPFTRISEITEKCRKANNNYFESRGGFKRYSGFPNEVVYAGRFFIERLRQTFPLSHSRSETTYRILCVDDNGSEVTKLSEHYNLDSCKRHIAKITQYAAPRTKPTEYEEYCNRVNAAHGLRFGVIDIEVQE